MMAMSLDRGQIVLQALILLGILGTHRAVHAQSTGPQKHTMAAMEKSLIRQQASIRLQLTTQQRRQRTGGSPSKSAPEAQAIFATALQTGGARCGAMSPDELSRQIATAATAHDLPSDLLEVVAHVESGFVPCAISPAGARGLMQIMPQTGRDLGLVDPWDSQQSLSAGAKYLRELLDRYGGNVALALSAYNAGPATVDRYGTVPPIKETRDYVRRIMLELSTRPRLLTPE